MKCNECSKTMIKINRRVEIDKPEFYMTKREKEEFQVAKESGDLSDWIHGVVEYKCPECNARISTISETVKTYDSLILMWYFKAKRGGDYFSRFIFAYIAFNAYLKAYIIIDTDIDRKAIQRLKQNESYKRKYLSRVESDKELNEVWKSLIKELQDEPLLNSSRNIDDPEINGWWNCSGDDKNVLNPLPVGVVNSLDDWANMIEFWLGVRNNLFHGGKNPDVQRDIFLVEHAYKTIIEFMELELSNIGFNMENLEF